MAPGPAKDDAPRHGAPEGFKLTKNCPGRSNVKTQFISTLFNSSGYTAFVLNRNGDSDVHDDNQHTYIGKPAARSSDPDGAAER